MGNNLFYSIANIDGSTKLVLMINGKLYKSVGIANNKERSLNAVIGLLLLTPFDKLLNPSELAAYVDIKYTFLPLQYNKCDDDISYTNCPVQTKCWRL